MYLVILSSVPPSRKELFTRFTYIFHVSFSFVDLVIFHFFCFVSRFELFQFLVFAYLLLFRFLVHHIRHQTPEMSISTKVSIVPLLHLFHLIDHPIKYGFEGKKETRNK